MYITLFIINAESRNSLCEQHIVKESEIIGHLISKLTVGFSAILCLLLLILLVEEHFIKILHSSSINQII